MEEVGSIEKNESKRDRTNDVETCRKDQTDNSYLTLFGNI